MLTSYISKESTLRQLEQDITERQANVHNRLTHLQSLKCNIYEQYPQVYKQLMQLESLSQNFNNAASYKAMRKQIEAIRLARGEYSTSNDRLTYLLKAYYKILVEACPDLATTSEAISRVDDEQQLVRDEISQLTSEKEKQAQLKQTMPAYFFTRTPSRSTRTSFKNNVKEIMPITHVLEELTQAISIKEQALAYLQFRLRTLNNHYQILTEAQAATRLFEHPYSKLTFK